MDVVKIFDTTLRDGEQAPGYSMNTKEKIRLALQLEKLGVDVIEAGFPIASPDDFTAVQEIAARLTKPEICGLSRAREEDIKRAYEAVKGAPKPRIDTGSSTSEIHTEYKLKMSREEVVKKAVEAVKYAKSLCDRVDFSPEDAARSDRGFLVEVITAAIEAGADTINIPDTVGYSTPEEFGDLIRFLIKNTPSDDIIFSTHCHNDLGLAVANSLSGVRNGARQIECTINGIGERAGNASLEECTMAIATRKDLFQVQTNINTEEIVPSSQLLSRITGKGVQPNKAIVGANAFAHEAGIHQHGILCHEQTYEIMKPENVGWSSNKLVLGKHSGRHALNDRLEELGFSIEKTELDAIFNRFKNLADKKKEIYDEDIEMIASESLEELNTKQAFTMDQVQVSCGSHSIPTASVALKTDEEEIVKDANVGDGPIDAIYKGISRLTGVETKLTEYSIQTVTEGMDAQAVITIKFEKDGKVYSGRASDTDIIVASALAYLNGINRYLNYKNLKKENSKNP